MGKQKNSQWNRPHDDSHKKGNPNASKSATIKDGDHKKKSGSGSVKNIY